MVIPAINSANSGSPSKSRLTDAALSAGAAALQRQHMQCTPAVQRSAATLAPPAPPKAAIPTTEHSYLASLRAELAAQKQEAARMQAEFQQQLDVSQPPSAEQAEIAKMQEELAAVKKVQADLGAAKERAMAKKRAEDLAASEKAAMVQEQLAMMVKRNAAEELAAKAVKERMLEELAAARKMQEELAAAKEEVVALAKRKQEEDLAAKEKELMMQQQSAKLAEAKAAEIAAAKAHEAKMQAEMAETMALQAQLAEAKKVIDDEVAATQKLREQLNQEEQPATASASTSFATKLEKPASDQVMDVDPPSDLEGTKSVEAPAEKVEAKCSVEGTLVVSSLAAPREEVLRVNSAAPEPTKPHPTQETSGNQAVVSELLKRSGCESLSQSRLAEAFSKSSAASSSSASATVEMASAADIAEAIAQKKKLTSCMADASVPEPKKQKGKK